jgi:hypothetical protein
MPARIIKKRIRFFLAVEGESEQSFVRWLQLLSEGELSIHLDGYPRSGGGYKSMLENAVHRHEKQSKSKGASRERFLIVDGDRADVQDWSLDKLREEAAKHKFIVIVQCPNHEGLLYRMMPDKERDVPTAATAVAKLRTGWPTYQKPSNADMIDGHYSLDDLLRVARVDTDLGNLLMRIGLM